MPQFNPATYDDVNSRIDKFYAAHPAPEGRIVSRLLSDPNNLDEVVVESNVYIGEVLVANGLAFEKRGENFKDGANFTSHLENCETSAIGRALANMNYKKTKESPRPSSQEMGKVQAARQPTAPPAKPSPSPPASKPADKPSEAIGGPPMATEAQVRALNLRVDETGLEGKSITVGGKEYAVRRGVPTQETAAFARDLYAALGKYMEANKPQAVAA